MILAAAAFQAHASWPWWLAIPGIALIDVVLAGDNAVIIALAVRQLEPSQRLLGTAVGAGLAVVLRIGLTFFAAQLLGLDYVRLVGGMLVLWIAVKLVGASENNDAPGAGGKAATSLWSAVRLILLADLSMSIDNVLAVAAASRGNLLLMIFGLTLSIPLVVFTSSALSRLMERYAFLAWLGAGLLGKVAGEMIIVDPLFFPDPAHGPAPGMVHAAGAAGALAVVVAGWGLRAARRHRSI